MGFYNSVPNDPLITLIVDSELHSRQRLSRLLREIAPEFTGIAEAKNDAEALSKIERFSPNLIFVAAPVSPYLKQALTTGTAAHIPKVTVCKSFEEANGCVEAMGGYYLQKPVDAQHLRDLLDAICSARGSWHLVTNGVGNGLVHSNGNGFANGHHNGNGHSNGNGCQSTWLNRLVVRKQGRFKLLPVDKVIWFGTEFRLVYAYTEKRRYPIDLGLDQLEKRLDPSHFARVHRSAIVNASRIKEIVPTQGGRCKIILDDPQQRVLPLSASRAKPIKALMAERSAMD
ncbi:MAG TPA: hypothetical protein ENJ29_13845 [Bacteroidetes bacterium]|nr:hypothetical protein [Bacteroidota bacterium]